METLSVEIINPKAKILFKSQPFLASMLATLRRNEAVIPSLEEITQEVELVRQARHK